MEEYIKKEVIKRVDELILLIKNSPDYKRYIEIQKAMHENDNIMKIIKEIKSIQKEIVNLEYRKMNTTHLEERIASNLDELNSYPMYLEYTYLQDDLNSLFQEIKLMLENYINERIK